MSAEKMPSTKEKIFFWLIVGTISVFFAEVISCSEPFGLFKPWSAVLLVLLYGIHTLLLASLVFRGRVSFGALFAAGCIFGLYEAYITKVLFHPHWGASPLRYFGVDFLWTMILVLWWHVFFAFIIPLFVSERLLTRSRSILDALPRPIRKLLRTRTGFLVLVFFFVIWAALFMGGNMPIFWLAPIAIILNVILIGGLIMIFRKKVGTKYTMRSLLPDGKEFWILFGILMLIYIPLGILWAPERIAGLVGQAFILILYALFFGLLILNIRSSKKRNQKRIKIANMKLSWKGVLILIGAFSLVSLLVGISGIGVVFILLSFFFGIMIGFISLGVTIFQAFKS
jgi:hypothetical protein